MSDSRLRRGHDRPDAVRLRGERGVAFLPELVIAFVMTVVVATAVVRNIWEAHESGLRTYRRMRVLEELQGEMEYWKAQVFIYGANAPSPNSRHTVAIDTGKRGRRNWVLATFDPAPSVRLIPSSGMNAYEITVTASWPEGGVMQRESLRTAINQVR